MRDLEPRIATAGCARFLVSLRHPTTVVEDHDPLQTALPLPDRPSRAPDLSPTPDRALAFALADASSVLRSDDDGADGVRRTR